MKKRSWLFVLVVVLVVALASAACAQYESTDKSRFGIGMGIYSPSTMPGINSIWVAPMVDLHLTYDKDDRPNSYLTIGWFSSSGSNSSATMVPVTATYIKRFSKSPDRAFFVGGGPGLYFNHYAAAGEFVGIVSTTQTQTGLNLVTGYEFNSWFLELRYDAMGSLSNDLAGKVNFSGITFEIGNRIAL